jgi:hypothetical protein
VVGRASPWALAISFAVTPSLTRDPQQQLAARPTDRIRVGALERPEESFAELRFSFVAAVRSIHDVNHRAVSGPWKTQIAVGSSKF